MNTDHLSFRLGDEFVDAHRDKPVRWGFPVGGGNALGELTALTKYSREKSDGGPKERWHEVCRRVIEGMFSIQFDHCRAQRTPWNANKAQRAAEEAYDLLFDFIWTPPGRGLGMMGTEFVMEYGSAALQNCAFLSTESLGPRNPTFPFMRLMEMSMLGVGVGFDTRGAGKLQLHAPRNDQMRTYVITDDREGWIVSLDMILRSYLLPNQPRMIFDYDRIRPRGAVIKGFGGRAGGPGVLRTLHERLRWLFDGRAGQSLGVVDIVDVMNMIGSCVAAGNVRRSAEIAFGEKDDKSFLHAKNPFGNARRMGFQHDEEGNPLVGPDGRWLDHPDGGWGNVSNNSVQVNVGDDLTHIGEMQAINGEPGIMWLDLAQNYGRLGDPPNGRDHRVRGCNPCAEQSLESNECCTLVELFPTNTPDWPTFERAIKYAYLYAKTVTLLPTHWTESNEVMTRNRRIGTSMTGIAQYAERHTWNDLRNLCEKSYAVVTRYDDVYSEWLGVRQSIKTTSVKPSGTVSLLGGAWPGVHWPVAEGDYIRRQRFSAEEPVVEMFAEAGYHCEPDVMDPHNSVVVEFPTTGPSGRDQRQVRVWEKVALAALMGKHWADNMCSATFSFTPDEANQIPAILRAFDGQLKTMSFLPLGDNVTSETYRQLPYEAVPQEQFEAARAKVKHIDWSRLYDAGGETEVERGCDNDSCEV